MNPTLIHFQRVVKAFGQKVIYNGLNLDVQRGEVLTVLGGSGVGKSVMLKMLIGLLRADRGTIIFDGDDVTKMNEDKLAIVRQRIAMLFQSGALFDSLSVGENVAYGLEEHFGQKMTRDEISERVDWALSLVDLPGIEEMRPSDLSGGMRKRVALARAIAVRWKSTPSGPIRDGTSTRIGSSETGATAAIGTPWSAGIAAEVTRGPPGRQGGSTPPGLAVQRSSAAQIVR